MGTYIGICIGKYEFVTRKNSFGDMLSIFSKEDLKIEEAIDEEGNLYKRYYFVTTVLRARQALSCLGYTLDTARHDFEKCKAEKLEYLNWCLEDDDSLDEEYKELENEFTFEEWKNAVQKYGKILVEHGNYIDEQKKEELLCKLPVAERMVINSLEWDSECYFGLEYEFINGWNVFRIILDGLDSDEQIILDYTDLYDSGWCGEFPEDEEFDVPKTIILTEGKFDVEVISKSMQAIYPYMSKYYSFINFSDYNVQGSTNFLTHYVKAFIAAGIQNRMIALYDNDTAGRAELLILEKMECPKNFKIMHLPEIDLAKEYPTLGPNGSECMDINGKACSIELFLGEDILQDDNGNLFPIQWGVFNEKTGTYQGEIKNKSIIQDRFRNKLNGKLGQSDFAKENWTEMRMLLESIFSAFL